MAIIQTSKTRKPNRYPGVDSTPWVVKDSTGKQVGGTFPGFGTANTEARRYTEATGEFAQAVRS